MADLSSLSPITTTATALSNLILVTPQTNIGYQAQNAPSIDGQTTSQVESILFDYEGEQSISLSSDITDHYVEDNTAIQDQIAIKPATVTTHGYIGELTDVVPELLKPLKKIADKLTVLTAYTPELTSTAQLAYAEAFQLYQVSMNVTNAVKSVATWGSLKNQTKQQIAFSKFYGYFQSRTLFTIQTPWRIYSDMAIQSLRAVQGEDTRMVSDFEITFKEMRFASTIINPAIGSGMQGRAALQGGVIVDSGTYSPPAVQGLQESLGANFPGSVGA